MASDPNWSQFCDLVDIDGARTDELGLAARDFKRTMTQYCQLRFNTDQIRYLVNIVNSPAVINAVVTSLNHQTSDADAINTAVQGVIV